MKKKITLIFLLLIALSGQAQNDSISEKIKSQYAIALNGSTTGVGLELARSFNERLSLRLRFNIIDLSSFIEDRNVSIGEDQYSIDGGTTISEFDLSVQYNPFRSSSFKLVGGLGYFTQAKFLLKGQPTESTSYGEITLTPEDIGQVSFLVDYKGLAPYVGFGFGRAIPKNRVGLGIEIGTFYFTNQKVELTGTNMLSSILEQQDSFKEDIDGYRWYPFINLRLAVRL
jgi:hypothetical protein